MSRYQAVLFDWDDTLCYANPHRFVHAQDVARSFGIDLTLPEVYRIFLRAGDSSGDDWARFVARLPVEIGIDADMQASFVHAYRVREVYRRFQLFDDVLDCIEGIGRRDLRVGIISNNVDVARNVATLDVGHRFEVIVSPETYGVAKPHPRIFRETLSALRIAPERAIYVGDSWENDVAGPRAIGMTPVLVDRFAVHDNGVDAEHHVAAFSELIDLLDRLLSEG